MGSGMFDDTFGMFGNSCDKSMHFRFMFYMYIPVFQAEVKAPSSPFVGIISKCFEAHLDIYIESQDG